MTLISRALLVLAPAGLVVSWPVIAQTQAVVGAGAPVSGPASSQASPVYALPNDPWIYRGTDIPVDEEWLMGEMPNGLRYAVRGNGVPPGQVSIRVRIDAGSLHENDDERGFAHLIEHLVFRQSRDLGEGEAIPHFQRLGAALGSDTNAITSPTQTVFQLDLPNATPSVLDESMRLFAGMIREPALSASNLRADLPIVLAERRERADPQMRVADEIRRTIFAGQRLAVREPIGQISTLEAATPRGVQAFHKRWYRPENAVVVVVGDADPQVLAAMVEKHYGDWKGVGTAGVEPDFGKPTLPANAPAPKPGVLPVGAATVIVEPSLQSNLTYGIMRPWVKVDDNIEYNRLILLDSIAQAIVNRRLEARARASGKFLIAGIQTDKPSRSADATFVQVVPLSNDWKGALADAQAVIADAIAKPPSQAEIDREVAEFNVVFANMTQQAEIQAGAKLANDLVTAVDIREAVAAPSTVEDVFLGMSERFTPAILHARTKTLFEGDVVNAVLLTTDPAAGTEADLRAALAIPATAGSYERTVDKVIDLADQPALGTAQPPVAREAMASIYGHDVEQLTFANGVKSMIWGSNNEPGRVTVRVRFGAGWRGFEADEGVYAELGELALISTGLGELSQDDLDRLATGRKLTFDFAIEDGVFSFEGRTRAEDLPGQLYLFAAKLAQPRWDANPFERAKASAVLSYGSYAGSPNGVLTRDLDWALRDQDPRYATPTPEQLQAATIDGFKSVWTRLMAQGPLEVDVFGDIDREATVAVLSETFGALPARAPLPEELVNQKLAFPAANTEPVIRRHQGDATQAAAVIAWPTNAGSANLPESRQVELLAEIISDRLMNYLREKTGASYAPYVSSNWPMDTNSGGYLVALAQLTPDQLGAFYEAADAIVQDLATTGPTDEELARVKEPLVQLITRVQTGHTYWLNELAGTPFDDSRGRHLATRLTDYTDTTPAQIKELAARYLTSHGGFRMVILPEQGSGQGATVGR